MMIPAIEELSTSYNPTSKWSLFLMLLLVYMWVYMPYGIIKETLLEKRKKKNWGWVKDGIPTVLGSLVILALLSWPIKEMSDNCNNFVFDDGGYDWRCNDGYMRMVGKSFTSIQACDACDGTGERPSLQWFDE
jgi:hypothetical protein